MEEYLIVRDDTASWADLVRFLAYGGSEEKVLETGRIGSLEERGPGVSELNRDHRWVIVFSIVVRRIIIFLRNPMELFGRVLEFFLNLLYLNGGDLIGFIRNLLTRMDLSFINLIGMV
jgi:hypothetical protein